MSAGSASIVSSINNNFGLSLPDTISPGELKEALSAHINHLINDDFEKLVFHLYRIDVDETKMRQLLSQNNGENAASLIADLVIERQLQKTKSRKEFPGSDTVPDEEKW